MRKIYLILALGLVIFCLNAQVGVGTNSPDPSAILEIESTDKGLLIPRMTTSERTNISAPVNALIVFDTDFQCLFSYSASTTKWRSLCPAESSENVFYPVFRAYKNADTTLPVNNVRYNIPFEVTSLNILDAGSYNSTTGGITLQPGTYKISYSLVCIPTDTFDSGAIFLSSFENASGSAAGSII